MRRPFTHRERGGRDMRAVAPAACMWAATLATLMAVRADPTGGAAALRACMRVGVPVCVVACALPLVMTARMRRRAATFARLWTAVLLCVGAMTLGALAALAHESAVLSDALMETTARGAAHGVFDMRVRAPATRTGSTSRFACAVDVETRRVSVEDLTRASHARARLMAHESDCARLRQGATVRARATARRAVYDEHLVRIEAQDVATLEDPAWPWRAVDALRTRFFAVTSRLDGQGAVLVPGVTLGVLGQRVVVDDAARDVDESYARRLEERCSRAGIIHLMAVSGGHYALLARACALLCALVPAPRRLLALTQTGAYLTLTMVLMPGESVTRALIMGLLRVGFLLCGRPAQTAHALCWTVMLGLLADPRRAADYGFALSCAAVLGITSAGARLRERLARWMPGACATALATTLGAQLCTLPVQILMDPDVPLWSVPANLLVAPGMDLATVCGLLSCVASAVSPTLAWRLAQLAALGTRPIELAADWFGADERAVAPWASGVTGALLMILAEAALLALAFAIPAFAGIALDMRHAARTDAFGTRRDPALTARRWWAQTKGMLAALTWRARRRRR